VGERECSVQFRHQKVIEEAPCVALSAGARESLTAGALAIARAIGYVGLGTVEFLYDMKTNRSSFLEVNPRLQVEHPVTEAVSGIDLVREQLLVALGEPLGFEQNDITVRGHAIEARITAQDPDRGLQPSPGTVTLWRPPAAGGLRLDSHVFEGYRFPPFYDALMGKLIGWGPDRSSAIATLQNGLGRFAVDGLKTSLPLLRRIVAHPDFQSDSVTTDWLTDALSAFAT
jgi:acetyl-CoA carboxylase biotin carboxylase subunit